MWLNTVGMSQAKRTQLARLKNMLNSGVLSTSVDGVSTTFRSQNDLAKAITRLETELGDRAPRARFRTPFMGHR
jgi:hypothetical protein